MVSERFALEFERLSCGFGCGKAAASLPPPKGIEVSGPLLFWLFLAG